jgi:hypothetical protein
MISARAGLSWSSVTAKKPKGRRGRRSDGGIFRIGRRSQMQKPTTKRTAAAAAPRRTRFPQSLKTADVADVLTASKTDEKIPSRVFMSVRSSPFVFPHNNGDAVCVIV